jgi:hypothetical protein
MDSKDYEAGVGATAVDASANTAPTTVEEGGPIQLPSGLMYRKFLGVLPWYASPKFQLGMVAFVCFLCPGMFNALGGLGGGGKADATLADNMVSTIIDRPRSGLHMR